MIWGNGLHIYWGLALIKAYAQYPARAGLDFTRRALYESLEKIIKLEGQS